MAREFTAIIERNVDWADGSVSEPYEVGWAREAILFARVLADDEGDGACRAHVQLSPDGQHWTDCDDVLDMPATTKRLGMVRLSHFGNWIRLRVAADASATRRVLVTLHLKE
jgi:hypothetical protein